MMVRLETKANDAGRIRLGLDFRYWMRNSFSWVGKKKHWFYRGNLHIIRFGLTLSSACRIPQVLTSVDVVDKDNKMKNDHQRTYFTEENHINLSKNPDMTMKIIILSSRSQKETKMLRQEELGRDPIRSTRIVVLVRKKSDQKEVLQTLFSKDGFCKRRSLATSNFLKCTRSKSAATCLIFFRERWSAYFMRLSFVKTPCSCTFPFVDSNKILRYLIKTLRLD